MQLRESAKQIYGAERWLKHATHVIRKDGTIGAVLPTRDSRRLHRIAVAFGGHGDAPLTYGDFGKGFIHVLDEMSFPAILQELDTINDFVAYLSAKENFLTHGPKFVFHGGEEDLLAIYLVRGRSFPSVTGSLFLEDGIWNSLKERPEYQAKKKADEVSYFWDGLIETFAKHVAEASFEPGSSLSDAEVALRVMAREDRLSRRFLGRAYEDFIRNSSVVRSRMHRALSGVVYVFLALPHGIDRKERALELQLRCFVARGLNKDSTTAVGIATEIYKPQAGFSLDLVFLYKEDWTSDDQKTSDGIRSDLGYFVNAKQTEIQEDEYPSGP